MSFIVCAPEGGLTADPPMKFLIDCTERLLAKPFFRNRNLAGLRSA